MSLQLGGVLERIRRRVVFRVAVELTDEVVAVEAVEVVELAVVDAEAETALRAFCSSRADAFIAVSIVARLSSIYFSTPRSIAQRKKLSLPTVV